MKSKEFWSNIGNVINFMFMHRCIILKYVRSIKDIVWLIILFIITMSIINLSITVPLTNLLTMLTFNPLALLIIHPSYFVHQLYSLIIPFISITPIIMLSISKSTILTLHLIKLSLVLYLLLLYCIFASKIITCYYLKNTISMII